MVFRFIIFVEYELWSNVHSFLSISGGGASILPLAANVIVPKRSLRCHTVDKFTIWHYLAHNINHVFTLLQPQDTCQGAFVSFIFIHLTVSIIFVLKCPLPRILCVDKKKHSLYILAKLNALLSAILVIVAMAGLLIQLFLGPIKLFYYSNMFTFLCSSASYVFLFLGRLATLR